jgi:hypothetical protein
VPLCWAGRDSCCLEACLLSQCEVSESAGKAVRPPATYSAFWRLPFSLTLESWHL